MEVGLNLIGPILESSIVNKRWVAGRLSEDYFEYSGYGKVKFSCLEELSENMKRGIKQGSHPGEILKEEVIRARGLTIKRAAELLTLPSPTLSKILNGKSAITPIVAIKIAKVFGGNPDLWVRLQRTYDLRQAQVEFEQKPVDLRPIK
ncbi:HigA family addiction module antitoxin [Desertivirga arenae]|uniref:HigA family addiction module antitoxin n=1 Tax=Desertivirga arenae TaxID=2810309 RepID=UPI00350F242D